MMSSSYAKGVDFDGLYSVVVLDLEFIDEVRKKIIQIAARDTGTAKAFNELVNPLRSIPPITTEITGITNEKVSGKQIFFYVGRRFINWLKEISNNFKKVIIMIAHNGRHSDFPLLVKEYFDARVHFPYYSVVFWDSLFTLRKMKQLGIVPSASLGMCYQYLFSSPLPNAHDAAADVEGLIKVLEKLLKCKLCSYEACNALYNDNLGY